MADTSSDVPPPRRVGALIHGWATPSLFSHRAGNSPGPSDHRVAPGVVLTNADIVQMQKAGLSEEIILSKITGSPSIFDIGTQDLIRLKEAGVNDNIINAMVQKSGNR
jgi:hypothetical protein